MSNKIATAISAVLALTLTGSNAFAHEMAANIKGMEKCYGIAKAGQNDCGNSSHNCSGESKIDNDKDAWLLVPTGLCKKIVGGSTTPPEKNKK